MCGIAGFTTDRDIRSDNVISKMLKVIRYRGPDDENTFIDQSIAFGHLRLSIIDLEGGHQPRANGVNGGALVFNGEIYGYKHLAKEMLSKSHRLKDDSDTEVLFTLLNTIGIENTLNQINGMFALAFRPQNTKKIILARDRFGEKPLYYAVKNEQLIFASEIKSILQHPLCCNSAMDRESISTYLTTEYLLGESTGFVGIKKLLPGHFLIFENGHVAINKYFDTNDIPLIQHTNQAERIIMLEETLNQSIEELLVADVPVGVFLSGGIDSSLIAAISKQHQNGITAHTIKMPKGSFDESSHAIQVAKHLNIDLNVIEITNKDILDAFNNIGELLDQPFADSSMIPTYLVSQKTRQSVKVALGGDGADELFAGYVNFKLTRFSKLIALLPSISGKMLRRTLSLVSNDNSYMAKSFLLRQLSYGFGKDSRYQSMHFMSALSDFEQDNIWKEVILKTDRNGCTHQVIDTLLATSSADNVKNLQELFYKTYLPDDILFKVDRASMYNSLEVRSPFLSKNFAELAISCPSNDKLRGLTDLATLNRTLNFI
ncbi:MAG: asparagine synthase (glutamine-hydrolyzing) [Kangiella sp.]|nr:MAG: asparagine synthase (glutamine-hydrolyzing) [Kangiella sp.]